MTRKRKTETALKNIQTTIGNYSDVKLIEQFKWEFPGSGIFPVYPFEVEEVIRDNEFHFKEVYCRFLFIVFLLEGSVTYRFNNRTIVMKPGKVIVIPPGSCYEFFLKNREMYHKLTLEIGGTHIQSVCTILGLDHIQIFSLENQESYEKDIWRLANGLRGKNIDESAEIAGQTYTFLLRIAMLNRKQKDHHFILAQAQHYLEEPDFISISDCAEKLGIGISTLNHLFQNRLGISPIEYRNNHLIIQARELLSNMDLSLKEIADILGFCNQFYFSQLFKRIVGESPREYREKLRQQW